MHTEVRTAPSCRFREYSNTIHSNIFQIVHAHSAHFDYRWLIFFTAPCLSFLHTYVLLHHRLQLQQIFQLQKCYNLGIHIADAQRIFVILRRWDSRQKAGSPAR